MVKGFWQAPQRASTSLRLTCFAVHSHWQHVRQHKHFGCEICMPMQPCFVVADITSCFNVLFGRCVLGVAAAAAVSQAASTVRDTRGARLGLATPAATAAPAVVALNGPSVMVPTMAPAVAMAPESSPVMGMAPEMVPVMEMAPETAPGVAEAPAVMAEQGPTMMTPAIASGLPLPAFSSLSQLSSTCSCN